MKRDFSLLTVNLFHSLLCWQQGLCTEWQITVLDCKWAEVSTFVSSCTGSAASFSIWSIRGTCVFGLRGADSRQPKTSHQGPWEENISENEHKTLWIAYWVLTLIMTLAVMHNNWFIMLWFSQQSVYGQFNQLALVVEQWQQRNDRFIWCRSVFRFYMLLFSRIKLTQIWSKITVTETVTEKW